MLVEIALWLTAPVSWASRSSGLLGRSVALWSRAMRRRREWAPHMAECRSFVEHALAGLPTRRKALVLGSGLLQDVPMSALLKAFDEVILVDAAHLLPVRLSYLTNRKVRFVERDLSGFPADVTSHAGTASRSPPLADFAADPAVDFVLSANLLSQLPLPFTERRGAGEIGRAVVEGHLADLAQFGARVCLLTDVAYQEVGPGGIIGDDVDLLEGVILPMPDRDWWWDVAPRGEENQHIAFRHKVQAYGDFNQSRKRPPGDAGGQSGF